MSRYHMSKTNCPKCNTEIEFCRYESITAHLYPELKEQILDGDFGKVVCPHCNEVSFLVYDLLYHDAIGKYMICVGTDYSNTFSQFPIPKDYRFRYVQDLPRLKEKVTIFDDGLDDVAMEIVKMAIQDISKIDEEIYYVEISDNRIRFTIPEQEKALSVDLNLYYRSITILDESKFAEESKFLKIDRKFIEAI